MGRLAGESRRDWLLKELSRWGSARLDCAQDAKPAMAERIDNLLDALWAELPDWRRAELEEK